MLEKDHWFVWSVLESTILPMRYSLYVYDVAILCSDIILLCWISIVLDQLSLLTIKVHLVLEYLLKWLHSSEHCQCTCR